MQGLIEKYKGLRHLSPNMIGQFISDLEEEAVSVDNALDASTAMINELREQYDWTAKYADEWRNTAEQRGEEINELRDKVDTLEAAINRLRNRAHAGENGAAHWEEIASARLVLFEEARAEIEDLRDAVEIEDLRDAVEANGTDDAVDALRYGVNFAESGKKPVVTCWNPNERPSREGDGGAHHCPQCASGKTAVFEELDWVLHCLDCRHIFRTAEAAAPPSVEEAEATAEEMVADAFALFKKAGWTPVKSGFAIEPFATTRSVVFSQVFDEFNEASYDWHQRQIINAHKRGG